MKITKLEKQVLRNFLPYQDAESCAANSMSISDISVKIFENENEFLSPFTTMKGVIGSLVKKGLLISEDCEDNGFNMIYFGGMFDENQDLIKEYINLSKI